MRSNFEKFAIDACESTVRYSIDKAGQDRAGPGGAAAAAVFGRLAGLTGRAIH
jgi:hypothetical protein